MRRALWCPDDEEPITCDWFLDDSLDDHPPPLPQRQLWLAIAAGAILPLLLTLLVVVGSALFVATLFLTQGTYLVGFAGLPLP